MKKTVKISEIFNISVGTNLDYINTIDFIENPILYVSRRVGNNGVKNIVEKKVDLIPNKKNSISVPLGGNGRLTAYLQPYEFYSGQNIFILTPKESMSVPTLLFYCLIIRKNKFKYSAFGREANSTFASLKVPNTNFLPNYINSKKILSLLDLKHNFTNLLNFNDFFNKIKATNWKIFNLLDVFNIKKGKYISEELAKELPKGEINFVTTSEKNNGVKYKINVEPTVSTIYNPGCLSLAKNGNVGKVFFQDNYFVVTSDVIVLECKYKKLSLSEGIFLKYMLEPVWNLLNIIKLKKGIIISNLTVN
ncbi:MAG: restriction endonuclease subunit S [Spiroplasma ixodetis]|nr:restriction endonuclease subunit S [Spiroplasma ixodetis]MBP1528491.1 restriction endonuclease subunit S [Spiroplasma ixodetis]